MPYPKIPPLQAKYLTVEIPDISTADQRYVVVITVAQSGSAAGDVDSCTPSGNNTFTATDAIEVETDGASTGTVEVVVTIEVEPA